MFEQFPELGWHAALFCVAAASSVWALRDRGSRIAVWILVAATVGVAASHSGITGGFNPRLGRTVNFPDYFHYYVGAKYYPEVGHTHLYDCTVVAWSELQSQVAHVPEISATRSLTDIWTPRSTAEVIAAESGTCHRLFSPSRWQSFVADLLSLSEWASDSEWKNLLGDLGNNAPPTLNVVLHVAANVLPGGASRPDLYAVFDWVATMLLLPLAFLRIAGVRAACAFVLLQCFNALTLFGWTAGSYFRELWLIALALAILQLSRERFAWAGALLVLAAGFRVFPALFWLGAALSLVLSRRQAFWRFLAGSAATGAVLLIASVVLFGVPAWIDFVQHVLPRVGTSIGNNVGYLQAMVSPQLSQLPDVAPTGILRAGLRYEWVARGIYQEHRIVFEMLRGALLLLCALFALRLSPAKACVLFGTISVFLLLSPFCYYYAFLALAAMLVFERTREPGDMARWIATLLVFAGFYGLNPLMGFVAGNDAEWVYYGRCAWLLLFWIVFMTLSYVPIATLRIPSTLALPRPRAALVSFAVLALTLAGTLAARLGADRTVPPSNFRDAEDLMLRSTTSVTAEKMPGARSWSRNSDLELEGPSDDLVYVPIDAAGPGARRLSIALATAPDYCAMRVTVGQQSREVQLRTPGSTRRVVVDFGSIDLPAMIRLQPFDCPSKSRMRFAIDGVSLDPA